jgi:uncharacterized protein
MTREIIGKVLDKAKEDKFQIVSKKYSHVRFVEVPIDQMLKGAKIIGEITGTETLNPYFDKPTDIRYLADDDETPASKSLYISNVESLAVIENRKRYKMSYPPIPGTNVFEADESDMRVALGLNDSGIDVGYLKDGRGLFLKINQDQLLRSHTAILGQTGSGKSYLAAKIAVELLKMKRSSEVPSRVASPVIFDSSGEYSGRKEDISQNKIASVFNILNANEFHFPLLNEKFLPILYEIYDFDDRQESDLKYWFKNPDLESIVPKNDHVQSGLFKQSTAMEIIAKFHKLKITSTDQFANALEEHLKEYNKLKDTDSINIPYNIISRMKKLNLRIRKTMPDNDFIEYLSKGLIIDLSDYESYEERQIAILIFLRQIYNYAKSAKLKNKILIFIDEVHNYIPSVYKSFCKDEILRIAREGRKYGLMLCLLSQRPKRVDPTALSQCGNTFIFKIQNADDKKHIFDSVSLPDKLLNTSTARFNVGESIVCGDIVSSPIICSITEIDKLFLEEERKRSAEKYLSEIKAL